MNGVSRELLETWPGRFGFAGVLVAMAVEPDADAEDQSAEGRAEADGESLDGAALGRAVLAHIGGRPPRATCEALVEQGEYDAAASMLEDCEELRGREAELLDSRLAFARTRSAETVRQAVAELVRRADAAGFVLVAPDVDALVACARSRRVEAATKLAALRSGLDAYVKQETGGLERQIAEQEEQSRRNGTVAQPEAVAGTERAARERLAGLLKAGELVTVRALLKREPIGLSIPESVAQLPVWSLNSTPLQVLECHLQPTLRRPPGFNSWLASGTDAVRLLTAFDGLRLDSIEAAQEFANALARFLGASGETAVAHPYEGGYFTFLDGLFSAEPLSGLNLTGRVDLYVGSPGSTVVPPELNAHTPHVAVGPDLEPSGYTDRQATATLSLRDLLRLVVLPTDRATALLGLIASQWPVTALIGDSPADLGRLLESGPGEAWRTLRWITRLFLGGDASMAQAMDSCTGMDPGLLRVMLLHAERLDVGTGKAGRWGLEGAAWQDDEALVYALREELLGRCGGPAAQAAWWAALAACDTVDGVVERDFIAAWAEDCSTWDGAEAEVLAGTDELVLRGLLEPVNGDGHLRVPLPGAVRALHPGAKEQLGKALSTLQRAGERPPVPAEAVADRADDTSPGGWTAWHRNRFRPLPSFSAYTEAEARGADAAELAAVAAEVERSFRELSSAELVALVMPGTSDLGAVLRTLASEFQYQYVGAHIHLDVRSPASLAVDVSAPVLCAVLYEVLDNAAEAVAGRPGAVVRVAVLADSPEVLVEVQDNGPGLPPEARGRRVFLQDWTTRGAGRGQGLHRVRQFLVTCSGPAVEAGAEVFDSTHPTLSGAALRLVLPEGSGGAG